MKMNKAMLLATTAMTVFMNTAPITAFAQADDADKAVVEETATEAMETAIEATTEAEEELPYSYTIDEDGNIIFSFKKTYNLGFILTAKKAKKCFFVEFFFFLKILYAFISFFKFLHNSS